ncbi:MAG: hypothetical protein WA130_16595 [Candidatus Methanoperedens sp.]
MIILHDVIEAINNSPLCEGWLVGGVVERGWSNRDADLVVANQKTAEGLPSYFDLIVQEGKPEGPNIPVAGLKELMAFKFEFMKPAKTQGNSNEFYNINDFKKLKPGDYFVEPKYDGIRIQLRKAGYKVWILTDSGNDITEKLPNIAEEARTKIPFTVCILDCELAAYRGSQRLDHSGVTAFLHSTTPPEDYHLRLKPFDILLYEGADIREKELADRKKILAKVPWDESIHPIKYKLVKSEGVIAAINEMTTSEGAMIKDASSKYDMSGEGWYKWKKQYEIDAQVIAVDKKPDGYIYTCKVGNITIGDTYLTQVKANVGDIITVSVDHVTKKKDGTWGWYAPKVKEVRDDKKEPDPESVLQKISELPGSENTDVVQSQSSAEGNKNDIQDGKNVTLPGDTKPSGDPSKNLPLSDGKFVLQEHWWGGKHHFDLRFEKNNSEGKPIMIGWTLLADSLDELLTKVRDNDKILSKRKMYHDPKWLTFHGDIQPGNEGNPTRNFVAHMEIRDTGHYKFNRRQVDFVDMELSGTKNPELNGRFYLRLVNLNKDSEGNPKPEGEDTEEDWMFWKAKVVEAQIRSSIKFIAESFRVLETPAFSDDFVDVEVVVLSTNVTGNGRQYVLEDLQKNTIALNSDGGLIFAMGRHPNHDEEPDATDNVGVGQTYMEKDLLKSKARIYNTSTFPDMVKRIRLGLVRDVSIEGMVNNFKKVCNGDGCWQRAFGLMIQRAVFVHAGADPLAKIERILESLEGEMKKMTPNKKKDDASDATATTESTPAAKEIQAAPETVKDETKIQIAEAAPKTPPPAAPVVEAKPAAPEPAAEAAPPAPETAPRPDALEKVLGEFSNMKKTMSDMLSIMGEMKNMMSTGQIQSSAAQEAAPAVVAESQESQIERPPRVKESQATPNAAQSSFFNEVKKLVR